MRLYRSLAWLTLYLGAALSLLIECGWLGAPRVPNLEELPARLGSLTLAEELAFDPAALGDSPPERFCFRRVIDAEGNEGRLFLAYYRRAQRWSGRPHDVEKCFAALGWEEREAHRILEAHRPWSRGFERGAPGSNESIRVVHWLERPGPDRDALQLTELAERLRCGNGFRPDVISIYFEFPATASPSDEQYAEAIAELSAALERAWD